MIRHIVMLRFADGADEEAISRYTEALSALPELIPAVVDFSFGRNVGADAPQAGPNWDFVVTATFTNLDDYRRYATHPDHRALVDTHLDGLMIDRAAIQIAEPTAER